MLWFTGNVYSTSITRRHGTSVCTQQKKKHLVLFSIANMCYRMLVLVITTNTVYPFSTQTKSAGLSLLFSCFYFHMTYHFLF